MSCYLLRLIIYIYIYIYMYKLTGYKQELKTKCSFPPTRLQIEFCT